MPTGPTLGLEASIRKRAEMVERKKTTSFAKFIIKTHCTIEHYDEDRITLT